MQTPEDALASAQRYEAQLVVVTVTYYGGVVSGERRGEGDCRKAEDRLCIFLCKRTACVWSCAIHLQEYLVSH